MTSELAVARLALCLAVGMLLVLPLMAESEAEQEREERPSGPSLSLFNLFNRHRDRECGRRGLCPYVKRLIPHTFGYGVDSGHLSNEGYHNEPPSLCGNLCASDHACPGYQKCCPTNCGYACFDPVHVVEY